MQTSDHLRATEQQGLFVHVDGAVVVLLLARARRHVDEHFGLIGIELQVLHELLSLLQVRCRVAVVARQAVADADVVQYLGTRLHIIALPQALERLKVEGDALVHPAFVHGEEGAGVEALDLPCLVLDVETQSIAFLIRVTRPPQVAQR